VESRPVLLSGQSPIEDKDKPLPSELKLRPVRTRRYNKACEKTFPVSLTLVVGFSYTGVIQFMGFSLAEDPCTKH